MKINKIIPNFKKLSVYYQNKKIEQSEKKRKNPKNKKEKIKNIFVGIKI